MTPSGVALFTFLLLNSLFSKQTEELSIYQVSNLSEVFRILSELQIITIDDDEATFIILDPILITLVQTLEVIDTDALLEIAATLLYICLLYTSPSPRD